MGMSEETIAANAAVQRKVFAIAKGPDDQAAAERKLRDLLNEQIASLTDTQREAAGLTPDGINAQLKTVLSPWFRALLPSTLDPLSVPSNARCWRSTAKKMCTGSPPGKTWTRFATASRAGGNRRVKTVALPGLNHLLQKCQTGAVSEYGTIEETMNPAALSLIADWILETVSGSRR